MWKKRIAAVVLSVLMALSLLPATVFAASTVMLEGRLKISGEALVGKTLSADLREVEPEGVTENDISFVWSRMAESNDDEKPTELSKEKTYTITQEDLGAKIILTVTGLEEKGYSGSLKVSTDAVKLPESQDENVAEEEAESDAVTESQDENVTEEEAESDAVTEPQDGNMTEENQEEEELSDPVEGYSEDDYSSSDNVDTPGEDVQNQDETDGAGREEVGGIPVATEDEMDSEVQDPQRGTQILSGAGSAAMAGNPSGSPMDDTKEESTGEESVYQAEVSATDGSAVVDLGEIAYNEEEDAEGQYVFVKNTGTETLNFLSVSPQHFMVGDIVEPLEPGESVSLWVGPRPGTAPGTYEDTITYTSEEGIEVSYTAKMTVTDTDTPAVGGIATLSAVPASLVFTGTDGQTIQLKNEGLQEVTVQASSLAGTVTVTPADNVTLAVGASCEYKIIPDESSLERGKEYDDTVSFSDINDADNVVSVSVKTTLPAETPQPTETPQPAASDVSADTDSVDFGTSVEGYMEPPASKSVTLTNNGTADAELTCSAEDGSEPEYFDILLADQTVSAGRQTSFIIQPKEGLPVGTYEENLIVTDVAAAKNIKIHAIFSVESITHSLQLSAGSLEFASVKEGYGQIEAQQFEVTNNGNKAEVLDQPAASYFDISMVDSSSLTLQPGESVSFTVRPKTGLSVNNYQETVRIASADAKTDIVLSFQVVKGTATVTKIRQPDAITGLSNGTPKNAESLKLPSTVVIETTEGNMKASVTWDVENCAYSASSTKAQNFKVRGAVTLPDGVDNNNNLTLAVTIQVNVNSYSPKTASADDNQITGINYGGVYTTQSRISFTAVGAGMDNTSPRQGDTRYVPLHWKVINTNTWSAAPYTATFGLAQSGDYTLKVTFRLQQYNGSNWADLDQYDTKQVPFSISKAKVTAPGLDLTPAANRRNAVKTGDNTPIAPFIIILIAAVAVIGGVIYYRFKRKKK